MVHGGQVVEEFTLQVGESLEHPYTVFILCENISALSISKNN